jgi:hypothetical protein
MKAKTGISGKKIVSVAIVIFFALSQVSFAFDEYNPLVSSLRGQVIDEAPPAYTGPSQELVLTAGMR